MLCETLSSEKLPVLKQNTDFSNFAPFVNHPIVFNKAQFFKAAYLLETDLRPDSGILWASDKANPYGT